MNKTMRDVAALAGNPLDIAEARQFAAIIGASPSKGARSPVLWNAAFRTHGIEARMIPIDVTQESVAALLEALEGNGDFIGGAVAVPYKEIVARWLRDRLTREAASIGAVNCLYRGSDGRLGGTNTDGEGALCSFVTSCGSIAGKSLLILGPGGAGKAVSAYFANGVGPNGRIAIAGRAEAGRAFADRLGARWVSWEHIGNLLSGTDVLVNCTSVGAGAQAGQSPLTAEQIARLPAQAIVFDIIYQPRPSALLSLAAARGLRTLDGLAMNLEQAVLAYGHAAPQPYGANATRVAMEAAVQSIST